MSDPLDKTEIFQEEFKRITPEKLAPGMFLGKEKNYRLEKFLGAGGMGHVWLAAEIEDGVELRKVVCKVIPSLVQREKKEMRKVLKTFHLVQPLSHPNICPIYGLKSDPICGYFFVMGYADGGTLDDWFHAQPGYADGLPVSQVAEVLRPIAQALDHAHEMGIVHRDVKPQNILFVKRREQKIPWLIDFGISSRIQQTTTQTMTEQGSSGTPAYMAPEQCQNETQDGRTDQYALGVLTYQLLSGHLPFSANNPLALWGQIVNMPAPPLTNVSAEVNSVVLRALSKNRKNRFASCVEFVDALTGKKPSKSSSWSLWLESSKLSALGAIRPAVEALKKRKWFLLAGFLVLLLIGISLFLISAKRDETAGSAASLSEIKKRAEDPLPVTNESDFEMYGTSLTKYKGRSAQVVIPSVIRGQKVKSIGESAFKDCRFLRFVEIPESVTGIGNDAFSGCVSLTSVFIPEGVTTIGLSAFSYCRSLKSVVIPEGVVEIGSKAFTRCGSLTSIVIPKGARVIPGSAFKGCASLSSVVISDGVRDIGPEAFQGCGLLTSVVIPESMKEIGEKAFQDCRSLTSVVIPEGVMRIGENVFSGCPKLTIYTPEDSNAELYARKNIIPFKVLQEDDSEPEPTSEDAAAAEPTSRDSFEWDGTKITKFIGKETDVIIPDDVTEIGDHVFDSCSFLKSVVIPDGVTKIGLGAFDSCLSLTSVTIPDSIKEIESGVFAGCMSLKEWPISSEHPYFKTDGTGLLTKDGEKLVACLGSTKEYRIPESVKEIGDCAFRSCSSLKSVVIPEGVKKIGEMAFDSCSSLMSVVIPEGVKEIESFTFFRCSSLTSVVIPESVKEIGESAFCDCRSLKSVVIPEGVTEIGEGAFQHCPKLTIHAPAGSKAEEYAKEYKIPFEALQEDDSEPKTTSRDSFEWDGTKITKFIGKETDVIIPEGVTEIGDQVFDSCSSLTSVVIPDGVTKIGRFAFYRCSSLKSVVIPNGVTMVGLGAFYDCSSLTSVTIPDSIKEIESGVFAGCMSLKEWPISSEHPYFKTDGTGLLTKDGKILIACLTSVTEYRIPEGVTGIGSWAFEGCKSLTFVVIPEGVTAIGDCAFEDCSSLTSVIIPESVKYIGRGALEGCSSLTSVVIPEGVTEIGSNAFDNCPKLTIHAPAGSKAEEYAKEHKITFEAE